MEDGIMLNRKNLVMLIMISMILMLVPASAFSQKTVAFIGKSPDPGNRVDSLLIDHLSQTYTVTVVDDDSVMNGTFTKADLAQFDFGFVSESASTWRLQSAPDNFYKIAPVPMFYTELYASKHSVAGWVASGGAFGGVSDTLLEGSTITIVDADQHYLSAGFANGATVTVVDSTTNADKNMLTYCVPQIDYIPIAVWTGDASQVVVMGVEVGTRLWNDDGSAVTDEFISQNRSAAVGVFAQANDFITADGYQLIDTGIEWVLGAAPSDGFINAPIETQTSAFVAEFNATATADSVDGVIGFSKAWPSSYGAYSIKILFNNEGFVIANNGGSFEADSAFAYTGGTTYAIKVVGNILEQDYSLWIQDGVSDPVLIGENFAFASDPGVVDSLNYRSVKMSFHPQWGGNVGAVEIADFTIGYPDEVNINTPFASQTGRFMFEFNVLPTADQVDGVVGFSQEKPVNWGEPLKLLFNNQGFFMARNGGSYGAVNDFAYTGGMTYNVRMVIDIPMQTYDVWIAPAGGQEVVIAKDFAFDGVADSLLWRTVIMSFAQPWGGAYGFVEITNFTISDAPVEMLSVAFIGKWPSGQPDSRDSLLVDHLSQTYAVTRVADDTIMAGIFTRDDLAQFDFGFVSESASTWKLSSAPDNFYKIASVPMFYTENYASKRNVAGWVSAEGFFGTIYDTLGQANGQTVLIVDDTGHPLSAGFGFGSEVDIVSGPGDPEGRTLTYCIPEIDYIPIAVWKGDPDLSIVHGVEAGTKLWDDLGLTIPDTLVSEFRAAAVGVFASANKNITADGFALIDAGIAWILDTTVTSVENLSLVTPVTYGLEQNYPNPFNPTTEITFTLAKPGLTTLKVYNVIGQEVATLINSEMNQGQYNYTFNAQNLASGVYFYQLRSGNYTQIKKMVLMK